LVSRLNKEIVLIKKEKKMDLEINIEEEKRKLKNRLNEIISELIHNEHYVIGGKRNEEERKSEEAKKKNESLVANHPLNKAYDPVRNEETIKWFLLILSFFLFLSQVLVHCTQKVHEALKQTFPYLFVKKKENEKIPRFVSQVIFYLFSIEVRSFAHFFFFIFFFFLLLLSS
jgi:hypothetical protein